MVTPRIHFGATGYGMLSLFRIERSEAVSLLKEALNHGITFWNGGTFYGPPSNNSLHILQEYFTLYPSDASKVTLSMKGALEFPSHTPDCSATGIRSSVDQALSILGDVKKIDIFELARIDPDVDVVESMKCLKELVAEGKIGGVGLSEVKASTIRKAHEVWPLTMVENELSLFSRDDIANGVLETCKELGITYVAYSPLSRGLLTDTFKTVTDLAENDMRRIRPRFQPDVFDHNFQLANAVGEIAKAKGVTTAQVALAWVRGKGAVPIFSATTRERIRENLVEVELSEEEMETLEQLLQGFEVKGGRYPVGHEKYLSQ